MNLGTYTKQPAEFLDYDMVYGEWLSAGDTLTSTVVTVEPADGLGVDAVLVSSPVIKLWLSGGANGTTYKLTLTTTTDAGRIKQDEFKLKVKDL
ncbi:MAG: hypothetical protein KA142_01410 [Chromatiaceae bacterium]|jgi:hypothetical protein|nr:hypothetical protein [Chromatiaceae bacterium]MBP9602627.1 hypothetical protein [Chromatiaceae bacterium]